MMHRFLTWLTDYMPAKFILIDGKPYIDRFFVIGWRGYNFYLHQFFSGDGQRDLHNHPWPFSFSIILRGSYIETFLAKWFASPHAVIKTNTRIVKRFNVITGNRFHNIDQVAPNTWTLFFVTPKTQHWGFINECGKLIPAPHMTENDWWKDAPTGKQLRDRRLSNNRR